MRRSIGGTAKRILAWVVVGIGTPACASGPVRPLSWASSQETMTDPSAFDFTESEIYAALRLVASDEEARRGARAFARAYTPGMDWGTVRENSPASIARDRLWQREGRADSACPAGGSLFGLAT